ncbi:MAG: dTDP-4-dehydrorhamnose reductase, partial [Planctomycetota bacterium]
MRVLVIGASGQVGKRLVARLRGAHEVVGTGCTRAEGLVKLDLADAKAVEKLVADVRPDAVLNPGGITAVDWCEDHADEATAVNAEGPAAAARAAKRIGAHFLHFSSDFVFDGAKGPYAEDDEPNPLSVYARSKLEGERRVLGEGGSIAVVRTAVVFSYGEGEKNFLMQILRAAREGKPYRAFTDHLNSPTQAENLSDAVVEFVERRIEGLYHVAGAEVVSRYACAQEALRRFGLPAEAVAPARMDEVPLKAARP